MAEPNPQTVPFEELQRAFMSATRQPTLFEIVEAMRAVLFETIDDTLELSGDEPGEGEST